MQSHYKAAASVIAEALEAAKRSVASKSGKLRESENRNADSNQLASNGKPPYCPPLYCLNVPKALCPSDCATSLSS